MECHEIQKLIPLYQDEELESQEHQLVKGHLAGCLSCQKEFQALEQSWAMLGELEEIEPQPGFVGQFWTDLSLQETWSEKFRRQIQDIMPNRQLMPALATACVVMVVGFLTFHNYQQIKGTDQLLAQLSDDELEMVQNIELAESFELIENIEFFEDFNIIANLDALET